MPNYLEINIREPLYSTEEGDTVCIYNKKINDAIKNRQYILIRSKNGEKVFMPKWIRENCPIIEKVFLRPDEPMKLYKIFIPKRKLKTEEEEIKELSEGGAFG
jgi:hypothetical protein